ncbi:MAG: NAD(P)/FAD-dependent oxidoreductase [Gammaproteobacteria bacterium]|nr:NAD(P)/FAD-dependent oxidoreductase [Gammaproteobacteria bacterium]
MQSKTPSIVIVGGGAGGLELAILLGHHLGKKNNATVTLIDASPTHIWKPLLHEIAAGTISPEDELDYLYCASNNFFQFSLGTMQSLNRDIKTIELAQILTPEETGYIPQREIAYDVLVMAVGSVANDFNIPGVRDHCIFLDNPDQARFFHQNLLKNLMSLSHQTVMHKKFNIAIVGGGATGIELATELHHAIHMIQHYGVDLNLQTISFTLIEAANRLLPSLPERLSSMVLKELERLGIKVELNEKVSKVTAESIETVSGKLIPANIKVWTAGIKAPEFLRHLDGLAVNYINQLIVNSTLQTTVDKDIFALGDCASCPQKNSHQFVPPRAQAAHQQAIFLAKTIPLYLTNKPLPVYYYRDHGSLITLSQNQVIGNLMGRITDNIMIEGFIARLLYRYLYKQHQSVLHGRWRTLLLTLANALSKKTRPRLKLH